MDFIKHPLLTGREREAFELLIHDNIIKEIAILISLCSK